VAGVICNLLGFRYRLPESFERRKNPIQATVVVRGFTMFADGQGTRRIADTFNTESIPGPRGGRWLQEAVARMLSNPIYSGLLVYGATRVTPKGGNTKARVKAEAVTESRSWRASFTT